MGAEKGERLTEQGCLSEGRERRGGKREKQGLREKPREGWRETERVAN